MLHDNTPAVTPARRILVIDDEPGIRSFTSRALSSAGFAVAEAASGHQGLRMALSDPPDLVLLDLGLPDLDGQELLRHLHQERPNQAVIVWSAAADRDAERQCLSLGARDCLPKPVSLAELLECIGAPGRPAAPGVALRARLSQRQEDGITLAGDGRLNDDGRRDVSSARSRPDSRCLLDPAGSHPRVPPARGRGTGRRYLLSPSRRGPQRRELTVWPHAGGGGP